MFVHLFTFDSLRHFMIQNIFEVKTSILHQFTELKASVVGILSRTEYPTVGFFFRWVSETTTAS